VKPIRDAACGSRPRRQTAPKHAECFATPDKQPQAEGIPAAPGITSSEEDMLQEVI
jgi:hypothetical protein